MSVQFNLPYSTLLDANGQPIPDGTVQFYTAGTLTPTDVYSDSELQTTISQPIEADSAGRIPRVFMDAGTYRVIVKDADGVTIKDYDDYDPGLSSALGTGSALPISGGGTGATTAAAARTALGVPSQSQLTTVANDLSALQTTVNGGLNESDEFGALASKDDISTAELAADFGAIDLQATVYVSTNANTSINSSIPVDSSIPQVGEGTELFSQAFTPVATDSKIVIDVFVQGGAASNSNVAVALFKDGAANASTANSKQFGNNDSAQVHLHHEETSGSTSSATWSVRVGGTFTLNATAGTNTLGQKIISWIRIREVKAF